MSGLYVNVNKYSTSPNDSTYFVTTYRPTSSSKDLRVVLVVVFLLALIALVYSAGVNTEPAPNPDMNTSSLKTNKHSR